MLCYLACSQGCGKSYDGPQLVEVGGQVTFSGGPIEGATVIFVPDDSGSQRRAAQAVTDANGQFKLYSMVGSDNDFVPGIPQGTYKVRISKRLESPTGERLPPKNLLPKKYAATKTSGLVAEVTENQENDFTFALTK